jgi:hypothetical protein
VSRGLGDVYKRQITHSAPSVSSMAEGALHSLEANLSGQGT